MTTRREFLKGSAASLASISAVSGGCVSPARTQLQGGSRRLLVRNPDHPEPSDLDKMPLEWHKGRARVLQQRAGEKGVDLIWLSDPRNVQYFTGLFAATTERPFAAFIPADELRVHFYYPGLDRDLVDTWWHDESEYYFDYPHAEGAFPHQGTVHMGSPVDLWAWMLDAMGRRGFADKTIGVDRPLTVGGLAGYQAALPGARFVEIGDVCMEMRMVKTSEEIALTQRAMNLGALGLAFARDYLLEHGTDATDWEVQCATQKFVMDEMMQQIDRDGRPHTAVGCGVEIIVRTGRGNAYPHTNQFHHNRIKRGDAFQVVCIPSIGGYNGEQYRSFQIAPWDDHRERVWDVHTESCMIQARELKAGSRCQDAALAVHRFQVEQGMEKYIYHRPAHGQGIEGHQPPYISLGDETVLQSGMMFSNEPGLYDPENGFGYNHSDNVLVTETKGLQMGSAPFSKEFCFLSI